MANRRGERGAVPYRDGRLHCIDNRWFFATRGPRLSGPYESQDAAERALEGERRKLREESTGSGGGSDTSGVHAAVRPI